MFNLFKKKEPKQSEPKQVTLFLLVNYSSIVNSKSYFGMREECTVTQGSEEYKAARKQYEEKLNSYQKILQEAQPDDFVQILDAVFQKKYFVSLILSDSEADMKK